jgi:tetratricopeptide (TPR) repeat protein
MGAPRRPLLALALLAGLALAPPREALAHDDLSAERGLVDSLASARPRDVALLLRRAGLSRLAGDTVAAGQDLAFVETLSPREPGLFLGRAALAEDRGDAAGTERWLERFLAVSDGVDARTIADALAQRARARLALGDSTGAIADFDRAFASAPAPRADWALMRARLAHARGADALPGLDRALARLPSDPALTYLAAEFEAGAGAVDSAVARLDRLSARADRKAAILARAGDLYAASGRRLDAEARWSQALLLIDQDHTYPSREAVENLRRQLESALYPAGNP